MNGLDDFITELKESLDSFVKEADTPVNFNPRNTVSFNPSDLKFLLESSFIKKSDLTTTGPITTTRTVINGSNVTLSLSQPGTVELLASINHSFNSTTGAYYFQFSNGSTLTGPDYNYVPIKTNSINTGTVMHSVSLASGISVIAVQGRTDGNQLTIYDGTITAKVFY